MYQKLSRALLLATAIGSQQVFSLGLGEMTMHSALNEPLDAEIVLNSIDDLDADQIRINMASLEQFKQSGIERAGFLSDIKFVVDIDQKNKTAVVKLTSNKRLKEPFLDFLLEAKWPTGRVLKSYTALVDLPVYAEAKVDAVVAPKKSSSTTTSSAVESQEAVQVQVRNDSADIESEVDQSEYASGGDYFTKRNDTLWEIANDYKGTSDISVQQMMLAIQQFNEDAFINGNINRLKAGVQLSIPSVDEARQLSFDQAVSEVNRQNSKWQEPQLDATKSSDAERQLVDVSGQVEDGHLSLASSGVGESNGQDDSQAASGSGGSNSEVSDQLAQVEQQLTDAAEQNQSLTDKVAELERMLEIKSTELAQLQQRLAQQQSTDSKNISIDSENTEKMATESDAAKDLETVELAVADTVDVSDAKAEAGSADSNNESEDKVVDNAAETDVDAETATEIVGDAEVNASDVAANTDNSSSLEQGDVQTKQEGAQETAQKQKVVTQTELEPWWKPFEQFLNPLYLGGVALVMMLLGALLIFRKKQQSENEALAQFDEDFELDSDQDDEQTAALDTLDDELSAEIFSGGVDDNIDEEQVVEIDENISDEQDESVNTDTEVQTDDAIGEADIYIAYGRYEQAAQLLKSAIASEPNNSALRNKLLEVHAQADDKENFQQEYLELEQLGDANALNEAKEMLSAHDNATSWLDDLPAAVSNDDLLEESVEEVVEADLDESLDHEIEALDLDADLGFDDVEAMDELEADLEADSESLDSLGDDLDGDLDLTGLDLSESEEELGLDVSEESELSLDLADDLELDSLNLGDANDAVDDTLTSDALDLDGFDIDSVDDKSLDLADSLDLDSDEFESVENSTDAVLSVDDLDDLDDLELSENLEEVNVEESLDDDLSLDLDSDLDDLDDDLSLDLDSVAEDELSADLGDLDDLSLDLDSASSDDDLALDLDADVSLGVESTSDIASDALDADLDLSEDLSLDLKTDLSIADNDSALKNSFSMDEIDLDDDFGVDEDITEIKVPDSPNATQTALTALSGDDLEFLSDSDEVATKLDLAKAYVEMGDDEGAQDILQEVLAEGNETQKSEAQSMLDSL